MIDGWIDKQMINKPNLHLEGSRDAGGLRAQNSPAKLVISRWQKGEVTLRKETGPWQVPWEHTERYPTVSGVASLTDSSKCMYAKSLQSCLTLCDPMDCSPSGSSVHGILQARILEWVAIPFSGESSQPRDWAHISCLLHWRAGFVTTSHT